MELQQGSTKEGTTKEGSTKEVLNEDVQNGYILFCKEYTNNAKKEGRTFKSMDDHHVEILNAWKALSGDERKAYSNRVKKARGTKEKRNKTVAFQTRCSISQFYDLVCYVNNNANLKARVERLGFGNLLNMGWTRLPRDFAAAVLRSYDPPTKSVRIRGKSLEIGANHVAELLGVPAKGKEVKAEVSDSNVQLQELEQYRTLPFSDIFEKIEGGVTGEEFDRLFMLYMLGTFLAPTSSSKVSDKLLKVVCYTKNGVNGFDWATYIAKELWSGLGDYVTAYRKNKQSKAFVGGCLYFLLLFFADRLSLSKERFSLSEEDVDVNSNAVIYWSEERLQKMITKEKDSNIGIKFGDSNIGITFGEVGMDEEVVKDNDEKEEKSGGNKMNATSYFDPVLKDMHRRLMDVIEDNHKKVVLQIEENKRNVVNCIEGELVKMQYALEQQRSRQNKRSDENDGEKMDDAMGDIGGQNGTEPTGPNDVTEHIGGDNASEHIVEDVEKEGSPITKQGGDKIISQVRRSEREKKPKNMSPWVVSRAIKRTRREKSEEAIFFDLISGACNEDEDKMELVRICDEDITRAQLRSLGNREKVLNRVMSVICKTLMADAQKAGDIRRHIFTYDFMEIIKKSLNWTPEDRKKELLPQYVGHNIADCDLLIGPTLVNDHWWCFALETSTGNFYVLDSMKPSFTIKFGKKKMGVREANYINAINAFRQAFYAIMDLLKPNSIVKKNLEEVIFPHVPQQSNLHDCGVHVLMWLNMWAPGESLTYDDAEVCENRMQLMWWLVNHELNLQKDVALALLPPEGAPKEKKYKRQKSTKRLNM